MEEFVFDNRIFNALAEVTGEADRSLNNIFIFCNKGETPEYFATDGHCALKIIEKEPEFNFSDDFVLALPDVLKKIIKYNKNEENQELNKTRVFFDEERQKIEIFNDVYMEISFALIEPKFDKMPDVFGGEMIEQKAFTFNPTIVERINKALKKLGFKSMTTFGLSDMKLTGCRENENFIVEFVIMGGRGETDEKQ